MTNVPQRVQISGSALLSIVKYGDKNAGRDVTGMLLGSKIGGDRSCVSPSQAPATPSASVESVPSDTPVSEESIEVTAAVPQLSSMSDGHVQIAKQLREANVEQKFVGWFISVALGAFISRHTVLSHYNMQKKDPSALLLVYDPYSTRQNRLVLRAYRLSDEAMRLIDEGRFTHADFAKHEVQSGELFTPLDVIVHNNHLAHAFLFDAAVGVSDNSDMCVDVDCDAEALGFAGANDLMLRKLNYMRRGLSYVLSGQAKLEEYQRRVRMKQEWEAKHKKEGRPLHGPHRLDSNMASSQALALVDELCKMTTEEYRKLAVAQEFFAASD
ncbi:MAG: hypothetical protein MHM6MM_004793 [Cercozoa sp. M6MM]